ncbi:hypothetical protein UACE39S_00776 [Ureibacillus acetophenoni]
MANQPKKYKKFVATAATATLVASAIVPVASAKSFNDVADNNDHKANIDKISDLGYMGTGDNFNPGANLTRGQVAIILANWAQKEAGKTVPADYTTAQRFEDVELTADDKLLQSAALVFDNEIFTGSNGNLLPANDITRLQMALVLNKAYKAVYGLTLVELAGDTSDVQIGDLDKIPAEQRDIVKALKKLGITAPANFDPNGKVTRGQFATFFIKTIEAEAPTPKVVSVSAINAVQLEVKFNKAVDESTVISSGNVINANFKVNGAALTGTNAAELSEDGKTLTITLGAGTWEGTYMFSTKKDAVKTVDGKNVAEFNQVVSYEDTVAPALLGTKTVNASTVNLQFSEPLKTKGTVIAKLADGTDISSLVVSNVVGSNIQLNLSNASIPVNQNITVTVVGTTDFSDNLLAVNPTSTTVVKGSKDGVAPTVTSVTPVNAKKFEIKLSEEVQNFAIGDIKVNGVALVAPATLTQDTTDKTKYTVTLSSAVSGLTTISVDAAQFTDLSGEDNTAFSQIVNFAADTVKPTLASATVKADANGKQNLHLVFSEDVTKIATGTVSLSATEVSNYVSSSTTLSFAAANLVPVANTSNEFTVALADITKTGAVALVKDASYTVDLPANIVADTAGNQNNAKAFAFTFTRGNDVNATKPSLDTTIDALETGDYVASNGILVVDQNTIKVKFIGDIDGATATNTANYQVSGATVKSATLNASNEVTLKLEANSNQYTGVRTVKVTGIKTKAGVVMNDHVTTEYLLENVVPVVTRVALTSVTQDDPTTAGTNEAETKVTLTFSEAVSVGVLDANDFELYIDGTKVTTGVTITTAAGATTDKVVVTIAGKALSASDLSKGVELRATSTIDIKDAAGNVTGTDKVVVSL